LVLYGIAFSFMEFASQKFIVAISYILIFNYLISKKASFYETLFTDY